MAILVRGERKLRGPLRLGAPGPGLFLLPGLVLAVLSLGAVVLDATYMGRALPGLRVGDVEVGALDEAGIRARLQREIAAPWSLARVTARSGERSWTATNVDLGIEPDVAGAASAALAFGRDRTLGARIDAWLDALTGRAAVPFAMRAEGESARLWVSEIAAAVDRPAADGEIRLGARGVEVTEPTAGTLVDRDALFARLLAAPRLADREVAVPVRSRIPAVDRAGMADALALAGATTTPIEVSAGDRGVAADAVTLATLLRIERVQARPGELPAVPTGAVAPTARYRYVARVDDARVRAWVEAVAAALDRRAKPAGYSVRPDGSLAVIPSTDGVRIDREALVMVALDRLARSEDAVKIITAPMVTERPAFTTEHAQRYMASMVPVAAFATSFPVDLARYTNIRVGASLFHDVVVPPGELSSFWATLGPDIAAKGLVPAGAIVDGRSDDSVVGGGLCQVSTTLFNAIARAGLEIVERHAHVYLIERYPLGLDAAVFHPSQDLRWRNDTPYPVLIRTSVTLTSVRFDLISVPTGRTVVFGDAVEKNAVPVTPDLKPDPGHAPGYSVPGRDVWRTRTVYEGGTVLHKDTFFSHYAPVWGGPAPAQ